MEEIQKEIFKRKEFRNLLINILSSLLTDICKENDISQIKNNEKINPFISKIKNSITIKNYLKRLVKYTQAESSTLIAMLIYIDRLCEINNFIINSFNVYKIIFSSLVIAIKYNEEEYFGNKYLAKVGGLSLNEMNLLELIYLNLIDFNLYVSDEVFQTYYNNINATINEIILK
jgi:hypothetical protein